MRFHYPLVILLLLILLSQPVTGLSGLIPVPPNTQVPSDPNGDGKYEDLNANGRQDFADVVLYFNQMAWIAANEPVAAFDYNGNSRIDFADVVALFNRLGSTPTATPTPGAGNISQAVNPSGADQVVRLDASTAVIIPGGLLTAPQTVTIDRVNNPPAPPHAGDQVLNALSVSIGTLHTFDKEVPIEIPYDPSTVSSGTDPAAVIQGAYWDPAASTWVPLPSTVDTTRNVVTVYTTHLSLIGDLRKYMNLPFVEGVHFLVYYDPDDDGFARAFDTGHTFSTAQVMAVHGAAVLDNAYDSYVAQGFRPPVPGALDINRTKVFVGRYDESEWSAKSGRIYISVIPDNPAPNEVSGLDRELRHELFHADQNRYWTTGTMYAHRWWTEATAEYASGVRPQLTSAYFQYPLTWDPSTEDQHKYQTAAFISYMHDAYPGVTFSSIWNHTSNATQVYASLDSLLKTQAGTTLSEAYRAFLFQRIWTPRSSGEYIDIFQDKIWFNRTWPIDEGILDGGLFTMGEETHHLERFITIPAEGTTRVWGIDVKGVPLRWTAESQEGRHLVMISAQEGLPEGVTFTLKSPDGGASLGQPYCGPKGGALLAIQNFPENYSELAPPGTRDNLLYLILTNTGTSDRTIRVSVDEPTIKTIPGELFAEQNVELGVQIVAENLPSGVDTVQFGPGGWVDVPVSGGRAETTMSFLSDSVGDVYLVFTLYLPTGPTGPTSPQWLATHYVTVHVRAQGT